MAEDMATKAPESDAQAVSGIPGDTKPDQGATSMVEHCVTDRPTHMQDTSKLGDVEVYISKPADYPHVSSRLLLLLTGGTGVHSVNNQLQADKYASEGFVVVMPDQFGGDSAPSTNTTAMSSAEENSTLIEQVKLGVATVAKSFTIDMWLARQTPEKVLPRLQAVLKSAREEFADAVSQGDGVYAVGYCVGAKYVVLLGAEDEAEKKPAIKCGAIAHGLQISPAELSSVKVPLSVVAVEGDPMFPDDVREEGMKALEKSSVEHECCVYSGVPHGFAVVGEYEESQIVTKQKEAFEQMLSWLKRH
ncbi:alpha/beta-hydrolase [Piedraia hortae CBS 480.64]|uniref:Alpha/beta-hydrolase n=1 Tax=Piedraia hortae CBS 480.64 TaxID=1314780 RepID=A0A6A7BVR7_9PEZI|nr:alpha/beta-hydrolase [Piedraia hortae CBS 480.64]